MTDATTNQYVLLDRLKGTTPSIPAMRDAAVEIKRLQDQLNTAISRIGDMLKEDDGHAFKEARKFIERV